MGVFVWNRARVQLDRHVGSLLSAPPRRVGGGGINPRESRGVGVRVPLLTQVCTPWEQLESKVSVSLLAELEGRLWESRGCLQRRIHNKM